MSAQSEVARRKIVNRLRRARGQLDGVISAIENEAGCRDVVTQLAAVTHALNRAGFLVVSTAMEECVAASASGEARDGMTTEELEKIFLSLA